MGDAAHSSWCGILFRLQEKFTVWNPASYNLEMRLPPPFIEKRCIVIADRDAVPLSAVISSYLFEPGTYLPLFTFPAVTAPKADGDDIPPEAYLSNAMGGEAATFINNAWARIHGSEYLVLAGLNAEQTSYISIPRGVKVIRIASPTEVREKLGVMPLRDRPELKCRAVDALKGLFAAERAARRLVMDESADPVTDADLTPGGIIVAEQDDVCSVIAVNYAASVGANLRLVPKATKSEIKQIHRSLQAWKQGGDGSQLEIVEEAVIARIGGVSFRDFEYATFFTSGLPYSLVLDNVVPCTYVHLTIRPDLFVFNSIVFENVNTFHSAVIFSPLFFPDEETTWLTRFFHDKNYHVRQLTGPSASFTNLDFTAQHFPYSVLHICSHGGEVDGWEVLEEFVDRNGNTHVIEYDEVVGCDLKVDQDGKVQVHRKAIFRKLDGFEWMSEELWANVPKHVSVDMWKALYQDQRNQLNPRAKRKKRRTIATSCAIKCSDTIHQGELHVLALHTSPLIFNNTCWSWYEVASFFLSCGSRGYIGTLWAIDNDSAILGARTFYENLFEGTVLDAFHKAVNTIATTQSKNIYVFWGLHFTKLSPATTAQDSRSEVFEGLVEGLMGWKQHVENSNSTEGRRNASKIVAALWKELQDNFTPTDVSKLQRRVSRPIRPASREAEYTVTEKEMPTSARRSFDYPTECKSVDELDAVLQSRVRTILADRTPPVP